MPETTENNSDFIVNLISLSSFLEQQDNIESSLRDLATMVAKALDSNNCSVMLLKENQESGELSLRVQAHCGNLPEAAYRESVSINRGIAGQVAKTGKALLVPDINKSEYANNASRTSQRNGGFISTPIVIGERVIGVININSPIDNRIFGTNDLELATILSLFIAKSIQTLHLQNLLKSKFAIAALAKEESVQRSTSGTFTQEPEKVAKILAKGFYNDMKRAGMSPNHILNAATEIIDLLHSTLERHKKWEARNKS